MISEVKEITEKIWLVDICLRGSEPDLLNKNRHITYIEVMAVDEQSALNTALQQFRIDCGYDPVLNLKIKSLGISSNNCKVGEAILI